MCEEEADKDKEKDKEREGEKEREREKHCRIAVIVVNVVNCFQLLLCVVANLIRRGGKELCECGRKWRS